MPRWILLLLTLSATLVRGHQDPRGEAHPRVTANADGTFTVTFRYWIPEREGRMRMLLGADGKELVPRHWYTPTEDRSNEIWDPGRTEPGFSLETVTPNENGTRLILRSPGGEAKGTVALPLDAKDFTGFQKAAVEGHEVAFTCGGYREDEERGIILSLWCCRRNGFQPGHKVLLGTAGSIYDFPTASAPLWCAGRWWVAWVEQRGEGEKTTWATVLSSVDPETGKTDRRDLPGLSNWNSSLSLAANAAGTICVAWHASLDGTYPGTAKIVTAVFTPGK
jgi:hypothetical protein